MQEQSPPVQEEDYRRIAENLCEVVFRCDRDGVLRWLSPMGDGAGGAFRESLLGRPLEERLHGHDRRRWRQAWADLLQGRPLRLELRLRQPTRGWRWIALTARPLREADGSVGGAVGGWDDIHSEREARGERLAGSGPPADPGDPWRISIESADIGMYDFHIPSGQVRYSPGYLKNLGYQPGEWQPRLEEWRDRLHPEDAPAVLGSMMNQRGTERFEMEYRLRHRDGSWRWLLDRGRVVEWDGRRRPVRAVGTHLDVSERRWTQEELERANERMRLAARADGIGFWEYDLLADRPLWDDEMLRIYGISREEFSATGEAWEAFLHPEDLNEQEFGLRQSWESSDGVLEQRFRIIRPDGEVRHIRSSALVSRDGEGRALRVTGINFDFTDKRRAEEAAMAAHLREQRTVLQQRRLLQQKLKTSLTAAAIAHEINQPLSIILLHCQMALARLEQNQGEEPWQETVRPLLGTLIEEAERMHTTIEKMRMLLRNVQTELTPVDLSNIVGSTLLYLLPRLRDTTVERIGLQRPCLIEGDEAQLQISVSNLVRNAIEALETTPAEKRRIRVELRREDPWVELVVGDSGSGFGGTPPDLTLLNTTKQDGSGLGLYVVRTTVDNHGGSVTLSHSPLGGAEVRLRFPLLG